LRDWIFSVAGQSIDRSIDERERKRSLKKQTKQSHETRESGKGAQYLDQSLPFRPPHFLGIPFWNHRLQFGLLILLRFGHQIWTRVCHLDPILNQSLPLPPHMTPLWASILDRCLPLHSHVTPGLGVNSGPESRLLHMHTKTSGQVQKKKKKKRPSNMRSEVEVQAPACISARLTKSEQNILA
jgi:hypothetical protein